ncbi:MAG: hypothetical protein IJG23_06235 [Clostridia bacterium]|nr:hypothetical protein [Clostridia bacterium]
MSLRDIALLAPAPFVAFGDISPRSGESPCTANVATQDDKEVIYFFVILSLSKDLLFIRVLV